MVSARALLTRLPGGIPQLISDKPNVAVSDARAKSHATNGENPPPKHHPLTMAMVGLAYIRSRLHCHVEASRRAFSFTISGAPSTSRKYSFRSIPAVHES